THQRFLDMMQKVLPNQSPMELEWKFDLVIAMLIRVLNQIEPLEPLSEKSSSQEIDDLVQRLVTFITFGISAEVRESSTINN
ncbi:MAG: hypothetical protein F6K24_19130, partial [Okeania sp. SIO2D1]|nr:hypothetical protein [Okeania sp. SIO2D1]